MSVVAFFTIDRLWLIAQGCDRANLAKGLSAAAEGTPVLLRDLRLLAGILCACRHRL
jgi:hypothetical protein